MKALPITSEGFSQLQREVKKLKTDDRNLIIKEISAAREFGDLSENAEYKAAKEKQNFLEKKISQLEKMLINCEIIDTKKLSNDTVKFGAFVDLISMDQNPTKCRYQIVGEYEANIKKEKISITSPLARALIKKSVNDLVDVETPKGIKSFKILSIEY